MEDRLQRGASGHDVMDINQYDPLPANYIPPFDAAEPEPRFAEAAMPMAALSFAVLLVAAMGLAVFTRYDVR